MEVLVATALTLLIMAATVTLMGSVTSGIADSRAIIETMERLRATGDRLTLDLRYHDTDQSRADCGNFLLVGAANAATTWCRGTFIVALKFDTSLNALK